VSTSNQQQRTIHDQNRGSQTQGRGEGKAATPFEQVLTDVEAKTFAKGWDAAVKAMKYE
jgi:hypothetical protein